METGALAKVTPFDPNSFEATQDPEISRDPRPLVAEERATEMVALQPLNFSLPPVVLPRSRPVEPIPAGLSDKEIAQLRAEILNSLQSRNPSTANVSRSTSSPNSVTESSSGGTSSHDARRLHTEVESLVRREMERLRTEGLVLEAPPSYTEGDTT